MNMLLKEFICRNNLSDRVIPGDVIKIMYKNINS